MQRLFENVIVQTQTIEILRKISNYALNLYEIQDCEENRERARNVPRHTNVHYLAPRTITEKQNIRYIAA